MRLVTIGKVTRLHGYQGALVVFADAGKESALSQLSQVWVGHSPEQAAVHQLQTASWMPKGWKIELAGITSEAAAQSLIGQTLYADRQDLPELDTNEYYLSDLIGLEAFEWETQQPIGTFKAIQESGQSGAVKATSWVFQTAHGELSIPAVVHFIHLVAIKEKKIWLKNLKELP